MEDVREDDGPFSQDDLSALSENRRIRKALIKSIVGDGTKVPEDRADKTLLVQLLNGADSEIIGRNRLIVAAKTEKAMTNMAGVVAQALRSHRPGQSLEDMTRDLVLPSSIPPVATVPGETECGVVSLSEADLQG